MSSAMSGTSSAPPTSSAAAGPTEGDRHAFAKLEALKEIRSKTIGLEKLRLRLLHDLEAVETEDKCLAEYRREMELLQQEKMAHVEELRQIHADINAMETVMKQAEEAKRQAHESARKVIDDYAPLKHDVDLMRTELLGLDKLPEFPPEDKERLGSAGLLEKPKPPLSVTDPRHPWHHPGASDRDADKGGFFGRHSGSGAATNPFLAAAAAQHSAMSAAMQQHHAHHAANAAAAQAAHHHNAMSGPFGAAASKQAADQLRTSLSAQASAGIPTAPAPFRQQPPPMKSCLSCHQQIHRNAPICPLCKAKSRSRNPKKPKNKKE